MPFSNPGPCNVTLTLINGTGFNTVEVPANAGAQYKAITEQLLYEIWQTLLLLLAGQNPPGMTPIIKFTIGDGQAGTPANGTTSLHAAVLQGVNISNRAILILREGIGLKYTTAATNNDIIRFNDGTDGGFDFDPARPGGQLHFATGEEYMLVITGQDTSIAP